MSQVLPDQPPLDSKSKTAAYINHVQKQISSIHIDKENKHSTHIDQENTHVSGTLDPHANSFIPRKNIIADTHVSDNHPYPSDRILTTDFTRFMLNQQSKVKNNPSFLYDSQQANTGFKDKLPTTKGKLNDVRTRKTDFAETKNERSQSVDPLYRAIRSCKGGMRFDEEQQVLTPIQMACTQIYLDNIGSKSCAKIKPVEVYLSDNPDRRLKVYALMDDQSNRTLGKSELFDYFGSTSVSDFILSTCSRES
ncbi:unnamed protein product [Mytilus edulis]|uniref:Uncharacterized protein n=1 Tax=Mytilus edulis TaxID=6550 RepID=A0A8S3U6K6_MYTED|nr:unnamed protein product [Mytilus edulis]